jgi:trimethylamine--corrinoid protein Co-methyltransferase
VEALISTARAGVPCCLLPQPYAGVTAPITLAGLLTVHNAEVLSGIVIAQLVHPGLPIIYGSAWTTFEMKEAHVMLGTPEAAMLRVAGAQMARHYRMPYHTTGPDSEPHVHDEQNGWERMMTLIAALGGGVDLLVNAGMFAAGMTVSFEQLVLDNEMVGIVRRLLTGMAVTEDSLATESIDRVGPGGHFMMEDDTLRHLRSGEHWEKIVSSRTVHEKWRLRGEPDVAVNARRHAREVLDTHRVTALPGATEQRLDAIIAAFENKVG